MMSMTDFFFMCLFFVLIATSLALHDQRIVSRLDALECAVQVEECE